MNGLARPKKPQTDKQTNKRLRTLWKKRRQPFLRLLGLVHQLKSVYTKVIATCSCSRHSYLSKSRECIIYHYYLGVIRGRECVFAEKVYFVGRDEVEKEHAGRIDEISPRQIGAKGEFPRSVRVARRRIGDGAIAEKPERNAALETKFSCAHNL